MDERARKIVKEWEREQGKYMTVKLACGHGYVEIQEPRDQMLYCSECPKTTYLVWQRKPKVEYEGI